MRPTIGRNQSGVYLLSPVQVSWDGLRWDRLDGPAKDSDFLFLASDFFSTAKPNFFFSKLKTKLGFFRAEKHETENSTQGFFISGRTWPRCRILPTPTCSGSIHCSLLKNTSPPMWPNLTMRILSKLMLAYRLHVLTRPYLL